MFSVSMQSTVSYNTSLISSEDDFLVSFGHIAMQCLGSERERERERRRGKE